MRRQAAGGSAGVDGGQADGALEAPAVVGRHFGSRFGGSGATPVLKAQAAATVAQNIL
jgi:hypothetical protein